MVEGIATLLILLCLLQAKHMLADFFLQTKSMLDGRENYFHLGRLVHAGIHAVGSALAFVLIGSPVAFIAAIALIEWVLHFHIDWWKAGYTLRLNLTPQDAAFWRATGIDQALHQFTYVAMIWAWVVFGLV